MLQLPLEHRAWDTQHFGFSVATIAETSLEVTELDKVLHAARDEKITLVYWASQVELPADSDLLTKYQGRLADRKTTYSKSLPMSDSDVAVDGITLREVDAADESPALIELGIAAGLWSRFALDPRFPRDKFRMLYEIWMRRSIRREIATTVLVAVDHGNEDLLGMVTISLNEAVGQIGLIAVAEHQRGRGLGRRLIDGADTWMRNHGAQTARVVTQGANAAACRLYERCGYELEKVEYLYHFWP